VKVLVTGASGYLGGEVARGLAAAGHAVRGLVLDGQPWPTCPAGAEVVAGDVTDAAALRRAALGCDVVVHAAALVRIWARDRSRFDRVNVDGFVHAADAARSAGARLIYVSSFLALGPTDDAVFDEDTPRRPDHRPHNDYERTKYIADRLAHERAARGEDVVRLYPGVLYGPGALTAGNHVVNLLLQHARGQLPGLLGPGDRPQCLAFIEDVVAGTVRAVTNAAPGSSYILGGENRTVRELFACFHEVSGIAPPRRRIPVAVAALIGRAQRWRAWATGREPQLTDEVVRIYQRGWAYSSARAERELGYRITPLRVGLQRTVAWLRTAGLLPARA
jgi:farnesol dehydrogenase